MLKNLALASVIALADAVKLECCPTTCCDGDKEHDDEAVPHDGEDWEEVIVEEVEDAVEVLEGGVEAELEQETENVIDEVLDEAAEEAVEMEEAADEGVEEALEEAVEDAAEVDAEVDAIEEAVEEAVDEVVEEETVEEEVVEEEVVEEETVVVEVEEEEEEVVEEIPEIAIEPEVVVEAASGGPTGLDYATLWKGQDCTGESMELAISEDGSSNDITYSQLGDMGWNDKAGSI